MPRGAALQSEILSGTDNPETEVQVFAVTRASLDIIQAWPPAQSDVRFNWTSASAAAVARTIRPGDLMSIAVWDSQPESLLTTGEQRMVNMQDVPVSASGRVFVPYVGELRVSGMTAEQARREIQQQLLAIVPDGQVQLTVTPGSANRIDVVTGVARPGRIELPEISPTILSVIAEAGGISPNLRNPLVRLNRAGVSYAVPAGDLFSNPAYDIQLRGGDRILVEQDGRSYIALGASGRQEVVYFEREHVSALDALSTIGGLQATRANLEGVMVLREYPASAVRPGIAYPDHQEVIFTFDLTSADGLFAAEQFQIQPGDVVLATESAAPLIANVMGILRNAAQTSRAFTN
ncbi:polysaccharide biosynthesis/export family protein [Pararhodobacter sp. CCB-MM2]|uniref:polysaccharide biosynthesis/export family protein n=1 Tax=Pararhodobacter sp. CCB-MM2 TaxID=1786003 RepID=UPI00082F6EDA|nr:polysaccharide biosynthesis/export family protein [Pararhodobacter sp. CCB-MM2]